MSGKCRASLRRKTLRNVELSDLSQTDKECIHAVFDRFDSAAADLVSAKAEIESYKAICSRAANIKPKAIKEFAERLKTKMFIADDNFNPVVTETEIDNLVKEIVGETNGASKKMQVARDRV